jgi:ornithine cyclodeaminase/alanine dehydrogenase-like protein (mu-crystallin family)
MAPVGDDARAWLDAVEAELVARALSQRAPAGPGAAPASTDAGRRGQTVAAPGLTAEQALAGRAAIAAKFLAVGTPRTLGLAGTRDLAPLLVAAQRAYAAPRELRVFDATPVEAARTADLVGGRVVSLAEVCACDIVICHGPLGVRREWVRGGTLVTVLDPSVILDPALLAAALVYADHAPPGVTATASLGAVAAGLVDGRTLDEITVLLPS